MPNPTRQVGRHPHSGKLVDELSSIELRQQLVTDALRGYPTDLAWFVAAIQRIAERDNIDQDDALVQVEQEVGSLGGFMPGRL